MRSIVKAGFLKHGHRLGREMGRRAPILIKSIEEQLSQGNIEAIMILISIEASKRHIIINIPDNTKDINKFLYGLSLSQENVTTAIVS